MIPEPNASVRAALRQLLASWQAEHGADDAELAAVLQGELQRVEERLQADALHGADCPHDWEPGLERATCRLCGEEREVEG